MQRPLVLALAVCALGVAIAMYLSRGKRVEPEHTAGPDPGGSEVTSETGGAGLASTPADPSASTDATAPANSRPEGFHGALDILVVSDEDGSPIAGARVWGERGTPSEALGSLTTDAGGRARWPDLDRREIAINAMAPGWTTESVRLAFDPQLTPLPFVVRLPSQREVRVRLVDAYGMDATPASLGFASRSSEYLTIGLAAACTAVGQRFDARGAPKHRALSDSWSGDVLAWRVKIRGRDPACVHLLLGDLVLAAVPLDPRSTELAIPVSRDDVHRWLEPIVVRVLAASTREPVRGAEVAINPSHFQYERRQSDELGIARFEDFFVGTFDLLVSAPGFAFQSIVEFRRPIEGEIEVLLKIGHDLDGVVLDPTGVPKTRVLLSAYDASELGGSAQLLQFVTTDAVGRFAFSMLPAEEVVLITSPLSGTASSTVLPSRENLTSAHHIVPCKGGAHDVVIQWVPLNPAAYARSRAGGVKD